MAVGRGQDGKDVGKLGIGLGGLRCIFDRLLVAPGQQCRPALAQVPDDQQRTARAEAHRFLRVRECGVVVTAEGVADAEIAARKHRVGIEVEGAAQAPSRLLMTTGEQVANRQRSMRHGVAVVGRDCLARRFTKPRVRFGRPVTPAENRLEMTRKGEIGERHRIRWVKRDGFVQEPSRLRQV